MHIKKGDTVKVISGDNKGKIGKVLKVLVKEERVVVEGVNIHKKHLKPNGQKEGSIVDREAPIHASNVMLIDPKTNKPTRIGHTVDKKGKKIRIARTSNESLD